MKIGAHVGSSTSPLEEIVACGGDIGQIFLSNPQGWKSPKPRDDAQEFLSSPLDIVIHSPYVTNIATPNNRVRIPARKLILETTRIAATIGALGVVVHGGHVTGNDDPTLGLDNWRKLFEFAEKEGGFAVPIYIENTAGGENAVVRTVDDLARLWDVVGPYGAEFCLDTCHAWAAGEDLETIAERAKSVCGKISLVHANDSRDAAGSGRDRHTNIGKGNIDPHLLAHVVREADAPTVVETHGGTEAQAKDIAFLKANV